MCFPINNFSIIVRPPPCTAMFVLSCADITYFISGSVAVDRRFNAASKKTSKLRECPYISSSNILQKGPPPPWLIIKSKHINVESTLKKCWSSTFINVASTLIFGWKWKLSRRTFIDVVLTSAKQRWNNVDRITSIQRRWLNVVSALILGWKGKLSQRMFIGVEEKALK